VLLGITVDSEYPEEVAAQLGYHIQGVAQANRLIMRRERIPSLYRSGVGYKVEPWAAHLQSLSNCREVLQRGWCECKSASAYLLATYREQAGSEELARQYDLQISWSDKPTDPLGVGLVPRDGIVRVFHIVVMKPDGSIEDPQKRLRVVR
jgi:hypothetical protein